MSLKIRPLPIALQEKAAKELNEVPSQIEENLEHLKNWLIKQEHLNSRKDSQLLLSFLRGSKNSLERAKEKLDAYYTYRSIAPELVGTMDPLTAPMQEFLNAGFCIPLSTPVCEPSSARIILVRFGAYNADEVTAITMMQAAAIIIDVLINEDDHFAISGVTSVFDMKGLQFKTATQVTPTLLRKIAFFHTEAYPTRFKKMIIINVPGYCEPMLNAFKLLVPKKFARRISFYSSKDWKLIYKDIPKTVFPTEYGGDAGPCDAIAAKWKNTIESHRDRLIAEVNYRSDESKRSSRPPAVDHLFGEEGSFRKLQID